MNIFEVTLDENQPLNHTDAIRVRNWPVLSMGIFSVFGILGNILVCLTIKRDNKLQTKTNYYLFSLAITDLAVCAFVLPLAIIQDFFDKWIFSIYICRFWIFSDILYSTCSIYHLTAVSILRYVAIQFPFKSNQSRSRFKTYVILFSIWFISISISSTVIYLSYIDVSNIMDPSRKCYLRNENFIVYGSIFAFVIPLLIMILMFILTVRSLRLQLSKLENYSPVKSNKTNISFKIESIKSSLAKQEKLNKHSIKNALNSRSEPRFSKRTCFFHFDKEFSNNSSLASMSQIDNSIKYNKNDLVDEVVQLKASTNSSKLRRKLAQNCNTKLYMQNEIKAVKVLGVVFACFIVAWLPFCLINIGSVICSIYKIDILHLHDFLNFLTYVGYVSSTFNPIIYTAFNKKFRQNFVEILKCSMK